jgi:hypothetical protein
MFCFARGPILSNAFRLAVATEVAAWRAGAES